MAFEFTQTQITQISALAEVPVEEGNREELYNTIFEAITDGYGTSEEVPKDGVDKSVWLWVRGARDVNSGSGYFADFIREYTEAQYELRNGQPLPNNWLQAASNNIAIAFANEILANSNFLPDIITTGVDDAGTIASGIFWGNFSPWAGTILFPFLGVDDFTQNWLLTNGTNANKLLSGTYDLISVAAVSHSITNVVEALWNELTSGNNSLGYTIENNAIGEAATLALLANLREEANQFFQETYGLPDEGRFQIGDDLPLYGPFDLLGSSDYSTHPNFILGTLNSDAAIETNDNVLTIGGDDIVHGGLGNDRIIGSSGNDLIDGGEGADILDYSGFSEGLKVTSEKVNGTLYQDRITIEDKLLNIATEGKTFAYGIEELRLTSQDDKVRFSGDSYIGFKLDTGGGNDEIISSALGLQVFAGNGNDTIEVTGSGSVVYSGSGNDKIAVGNNILIADASATDRLSYLGNTLSGAGKWHHSESPWSEWTKGVRYGINGEGQLVIEDLLGRQTFVENYNSSLSGGSDTAGIHLYEYAMDAILFFREDTISAEYSLGGNFQIIHNMMKSALGDAYVGDVVDPLVFDLDGDGLEIVADTSINPHFDMNGDGFAERAGWINGGDAANDNAECLDGRCVRIAA